MLYLFDLCLFYFRLYNYLRKLTKENPALVTGWIAANYLATGYVHEITDIESLVEDIIEQFNRPHTSQRM